jgi:uncharacterized protein
MALPHSLRERRVFVDSSAYLALLDEDDEHHAEAAAILSLLARGRYRQFTTNTLIIESHALLLSSLGHATARTFLQKVDTSNVTVIRVRESDEAIAKTILYRYTDKSFSFADAISFAVMERLGIHLAFTFDQHFAQYGLSILTAQHFG